MTQENTTINLADLLSASIDDLSDMPEFAVLPNGVHRVRIKFETKEVNKHPCVELKMVYIEVKELSEASDVAPVAGTEAGCLYMMDNELGQGQFKEVIRPLAVHLNEDNIGKVIEQAAGMEVTVVTKKRTNKDKTATYNSVVSLIVD